MNRADDPAAQVVVEIGGKAGRDAHTVFCALRTAYTSDREADDEPQQSADGRTTVWAATFDVSEVHEEPAPARLEEPVTATVQGGYQAVDNLRRTLGSAFAVRVVGTAAGDQEKEVQLELESHP
ncbi:hypothetical protein HUT18_30055 [Streptomyces sp. NA04227]|uniref:hypothetical protein n=1 Tax=Streptomyces sp. NA04227 TaxID=2742136 RepID=UPI00158FA325|nr:hypothetical protein [Streptomyces sp. NA04227]QKW10032.1 hypothetical protein HUT18_30055 [Streptomyces sp. NA04227]